MRDARPDVRHLGRSYTYVRFASGGRYCPGRSASRRRPLPKPAASAPPISPTAAMTPTTVPMKLSSKMSPVPMALATIPPITAPPIPSSTVSPAPMRCRPGSTRRARMPMTIPITMRPRICTPSSFPPRQPRNLWASKQPAERTEVEVQVFLGQAELLPQLLHSPIELHERLPQPLDLVLG